MDAEEYQWYISTATDDNGTPIIELGINDSEDIDGRAITIKFRGRVAMDYGNDQTNALVYSNFWSGHKGTAVAANLELLGSYEDPTGIVIARFSTHQ